MRKKIMQIEKYEREKRDNGSMESKCGERGVKRGVKRK